MSHLRNAEHSACIVHKKVRQILGRDGSTTCAEYRRLDSAGATTERAVLPGSTLVFLHGFTASHASWDPTARSLLERPNFLIASILAVDLPGHGTSRFDAADFTMEIAARSLEDVLDACHAESCLVVGYSMGGRLGLYFGVTRPNRLTALVLESTSAGLADEEDRATRRYADEALARDLLRDGVPPFVSRWEALPLFATQARLSAEQKQRQRSIRLAQNPNGLAACLRGMGTGSQPWLGNRLGALTMPVQWVVGAEDPKFRSLAEKMHLETPDSQLAIVENAGHTVHLEAPSDFEARLSNFVNQGHPPRTTS